MVSKKGKRKLIYEGRVFYWFVRMNSKEIPRLHILSEDKKIQLECALIDREVPAVSSYVRQILKEHMNQIN